MRHIHERMPVILPLDHEKEWLHPRGVSLFNPFSFELLTSYPVTTKMNRATFNDPEAIQRLGPVIT